jgi:outer membrane protein, heavy metal efflux system
MFRNTFQISVILSLVSGCVRYVPRPIDPPALEQSYRARTLADPRVEEFFKENSAVQPQAWPPQSIDLDGLTVLALYFSPDLDEARSRVAAADAAITTARVRPNPNVLAGGGYTDAEQSPYAFRFDLGIPFETAGKKRYRIRRAEQLTEAARFSLGETAWSVRSRLRAALVDHLLSGRELEQRTAERQIRQDIVEIYERRLEVGETSTPFVTAARTDLSRVQLEIEQLQGRIAATRAAIAGVVGLAAPALDNVQFAFADLENPPSEQALNIQLVQKTGLTNRLDVQRLLAEYAAADSDLRLQVARQYPDIALAPGYSFGEGANSYLIGPGLVLPLFDRNRGPIAEAEARRETAGVRFLGAQATAINEMERGLADYRSALRELSQAQSTLELVRQREQTTQRQLDAGEVDRLALVSVRLEAAAGDRDRLAALHRTHTALAELEDAVQHPLPPDTKMPEPTTINPRDAERKRDSAQPQGKKVGPSQ